MRLAIVGCKDSDEISEDDIFLVAELDRLGLKAERPVWNDPQIDWASYDLIVIRSVWDYHYHPADFTAWLDKLESLLVVNGLDTIRWNMHKGYLLDLQEKGVPIVETELCRQGKADLPKRALEWEKIVVKPAISASAHATRVFSSNDPEAVQHLRTVAQNGDVLVQPFLNAIQSAYEISLVFIDGLYSHAIRKYSKRGDFRVQFEYGGTYQITEPTESELAAAELTIQRCGFNPLFARVDICQSNDGKDVLMELELIEPELWVHSHEEGCRRLASAIQKQALSIR